MHVGKRVILHKVNLRATAQVLMVDDLMFGTENVFIYHNINQMP